jgi:lipopolysaccharide export system protein LptA
MINNHLKFGLLAALFSCFFTSNVTAKEITLKFPLQIKAQNHYAKLKEKVAVYEKGVVITHGGLEIKADYLEAYKRDELGDNMQLLIARGNPVTFSAKQDDGETIVASAELIKYDVATATFTMTGNAQFRQGNDSLNAHTIIYNRNEQTIQSHNKGDNQGQVETVIDTTGKGRQ